MLLATRMFNVDKTALSTAQKPQILPVRGKHQVGVITGQEREAQTQYACAA